MFNKQVDYDKIKQYRDPKCGSLEVLVAPNGLTYTWHPVEISDLLYRTKFGTKKCADLTYPFRSAEKNLLKKGWSKVVINYEDYFIGDYHINIDTIDKIVWGKLNQDQIVALFNILRKKSIHKKGELTK